MFQDATQVRVAVVGGQLEEVRCQVFDALGRAGLDMAEAVQVSVGRGNLQAIAQLIDLRAHAWVLPFHGQRSGGGLLDGLELARIAHAQAPSLRNIPIFMPVTHFGKVALELIAARGDGPEGLPASLQRVLMPLPLDALSDSAVPLRIAEHLEATLEWQDVASAPTETWIAARAGWDAPTPLGYYARESRPGPAVPLDPGHSRRMRRAATSGVIAASSPPLRGSLDAEIEHAQSPRGDAADPGVSRRMRKSASSGVVATTDPVVKPVRGSKERAG